MLKDSVDDTLLAAYLPPVVMVTTGLETLRLVLIGLSMEISVARERPIKVTLVMRGLRVRTTEYTLNRFKPKALKPRYNSVPISLWTTDFSLAVRIAITETLEEIVPGNLYTVADRCRNNGIKSDINDAMKGNG